MGFRESAELASYQPFRGRVTLAVVTAAKDVAAEAPADTELYRLRRALAVNVLSDPDRFVTPFSWAVVANPVIDLSSPDDAIQFTVNSIWNHMAGVPAEPA